MIAAGLKQARRFKQISLPVLWKIAQEQAKDKTGDRMQRHALAVIGAIYGSSADQKDLLHRLTDAKELALAEHLNKKLGCKKD